MPAALRRGGQQRQQHHAQQARHPLRPAGDPHGRRLPRRRRAGGPLAAHAGRARARGAGLRGLPGLDGGPVGRGFDGRPATCRRGATWRRSSSARGRRSRSSAWGPSGRRRSLAGPGRRRPRDARGAPARPDRWAAARASTPSAGGWPANLVSNASSWRPATRGMAEVAHRRPGSRARRWTRPTSGRSSTWRMNAARPRRESARRRRSWRVSPTRSARPASRSWGPAAAGARLEGSKSVSRAMATAAGVPMAAGARLRRGRRAALAFAAGLDGRVVVKADGLAAGKGVTVCDDETSVAGGHPRGARGRPLRRRRCARRGRGAPERPRGERHRPLRRDGGAGAAGGTRPQAPGRRRRGSEHRRHGRLSRRCTTSTTRRSSGILERSTPRPGGAGPSRDAVPRRPVRRPDAHRARARGCSSSTSASAIPRRRRSCPAWPCRSGRSWRPRAEGRLATAAVGLGLAPRAVLPAAPEASVAVVLAAAGYPERPQRGDPISGIERRRVPRARSSSRAGVDGADGGLVHCRRPRAHRGRPGERPRRRGAMPRTRRPAT